MVSRIWRAFGLKPHLTEAFKLSTDAQFIDKVGDVVGLHLEPHDAGCDECECTGLSRASGRAC
jgi:hypothetical protein